MLDPILSQPVLFAGVILGLAALLSRLPQPWRGRVWAALFWLWVLLVALLLAGFVARLRAAG